MSDEELAEWNRQHPEGSPCLLRLDNRTEVPTKTRSNAWRIGGGHVVVMVEGWTGGWRIERVKMVDENRKPDKSLALSGIDSQA